VNNVGWVLWCISVIPATQGSWTLSANKTKETNKIKETNKRNLLKHGKSSERAPDQRKYTNNK
jgi:ribosomal protein S19E (S16A)